MTTSTENVQYGCGLCAPDGWLNFDCSPSLKLQRLPLVGALAVKMTVKFPDAAKFGDIIGGLPISPGSAKNIYCSHTLEHLSLEDCKLALRNTLQALRPGGCFRMVLPDLRTAAEHYVRSTESDAAHVFLRETILGHERRVRSLPKFLRDEWLGNSKHMWMWDYASLSKALADAGFFKIRRAQFGDNPDPVWRAVESEDRWKGQLGIECYRPDR
jgi:hypothetical protein